MGAQVLVVVPLQWVHLEALQVPFKEMWSSWRIETAPLMAWVSRVSTRNGRLIWLVSLWCCTLSSLGWACRRGNSGRVLAWDRGASNLTRGAMVAGAVESVFLLLLALLATALCVGTGQGALKSC